MSATEQGEEQNKDLDCTMSEQQNDTVPEEVEESWFSEEYLNRLAVRIDRLSDVASQLGEFANSAMESFAQVFVSLPVLELIVTIGAFVSSGLAAKLGMEVLAGLVFAQAAALYLVSHYRKMAMHPIGLLAIFLAVLTGAVNTGAAVYLGLTVHSPEAAPQFTILLPAFSGGLSVLYYYVAKMFTAEQVAMRRTFSIETSAKLAEIQRSAAAQRKRETTLAEMQQTRLDMEHTALTALSADKIMQEIQKRAMWGTVVKDIMSLYDVKPQERTGKQILALMEKALKEETAVSDGSASAADSAPAADSATVADSAPTPPATKPRRRRRNGLPEALEKAIAGLSEEEAQALLEAAGAGDFLEPATNGYSNGHGKNGA